MQGRANHFTFFFEKKLLFREVTSQPHCFSSCGERQYYSASKIGLENINSGKTFKTKK